MKFIISFLLGFISLLLQAQTSDTIKRVAFLGDSQAVNWDTASHFLTLRQNGNLDTVLAYGLNGSSISNISEKQTPSIASFTSRVSTMSNDVDLVAVFGSTNDWYYAQFDTLSEQANLDSFKVGLIALCEALTNKYKLTKIVFITATQRNTSSPSGQAGLLKYADLILEICGNYSIEVFDAYRQSEIRTSNLALLTADGLHFNSEGFNVLGRWAGTKITQLRKVTNTVSDNLAQVCEGSTTGWSVNSSGDILITSAVGSRVGLFFKDQFDTLEFTKNVSMSYWIVVGGSPSSYVAICNDYAYQLATNMQPPSYTNTQAMPTPAANFSGWTRIKIVQTGGVYTMYAKDIEATNFTLIYTFNSSTSGLANLASVWVNNLLGFSRDSLGAGTIASDVKLNGQSILSYLD